MMVEHKSHVEHLNCLHSAVVVICYRVFRPARLHHLLCTSGMQSTQIKALKALLQGSHSRQNSWKQLSPQSPSYFGRAC
jgi:hypothetical protein